MANETHEIIIKSAKKEYKCILREPDFDVYSNAMMILERPKGGSDRLGAGKFVIETCWLSGDEAIKVDTKLLVSASIPALELLNIWDAELKKK